MHTFRPANGVYEIYFDAGDGTFRTLFEVPSLADACRAVCVLNGGAAGFNVISKREGDRIVLSHQILVPGK